MHSTFLESGVLFSTAIVGGNIPIATGVGLAIKYKKEKKVVVSFFGDGATNTGAFHEAVNLAAVWKLPVIFVCENNFYAISTSASEAVSARNIADRSVAYGIPGEVVDGTDVEAVHESTLKAVEGARDGRGPTLMECRTYRYKGHGIYMDPRIDTRVMESIWIPLLVEQKMS
jgi:TPP-dependent pyruvate/acetoin dehydrogenase alpha subunit